MTIKEILESSNKPKQSLKVAGGDDGKLKKYGDFIDILSGKKKFEGDIDSPEKMKQVIAGIERLFGDDNDSNATHSLKKGLSRIKKSIPKVKKVLAKIDNGDKISKDDEDVYDKFADGIEKIFFSETYMKDIAPQGENATSKPRQFLAFDNMFPISFKLNGRTYLGIVRPPTGIVTWNGKAARDAAKEANIPLKFPLVGKNYNINKSKMVDNLKKEVGLKYVDNANIRKKVKELVMASGAGYNKDGYPEPQKGMGGDQFNAKGLENIGFWKDLEALI